MNDRKRRCAKVHLRDGKRRAGVWSTIVTNCVLQKFFALVSFGDKESTKKIHKIMVEYLVTLSEGFLQFVSVGVKSLVPRHQFVSKHKAAQCVV